MLDGKSCCVVLFHERYCSSFYFTRDLHVLGGQRVYKEASLVAPSCGQVPHTDQWNGREFQKFIWSFLWFPFLSFLLISSTIFSLLFSFFIPIPHSDFLVLSLPFRCFFLFIFLDYFYFFIFYSVSSSNSFLWCTFTCKGGWCAITNMRKHSFVNHTDAAAAAAAPAFYFCFRMYMCVCVYVCMYVCMYVCRVWIWLIEKLFFYRYLLITVFRN